jgi:histone demethylase JARID1
MREMPTFHPTEEEFRYPILYIEKLIREEDAYSFGCIKIVPPPSFKPPVAFDRQSKQRLPTRYQVL